MHDDAIEYDASHIEVLEGLEAIRKRPGMYVGSTDERGLRELVLEVVERAVNEVLAGRARSVDVTLAPDGGVRVADDGPGYWYGDSTSPGDRGLEALLTEVYARTMPYGRNAVIAGRGGLGLCVPNALSSRLTAEVRRDGVHWVQEYAHGTAVGPPVAAGPATGTGTTITFFPDPEIFGTARCSSTALADRLRELAFLNQPLDISLTDERGPHAAPSTTRFRFPGGVTDFVAFADAGTGTPVHPDVIGFTSEAPPMEGVMEVALRWCDSRAERILSYANSTPTPQGGTHRAGFRDGVTSAVNTYARRHRLLPPTVPDLSADRIGRGLTAVVSVKLDRPEFQGSLLGGERVGACVAETVREHLAAWLEQHPERALAVISRLVSGSGRP